MKSHSNNQHPQDQSPDRLSTPETEQREILLAIKKAPKEKRTARVFQKQSSRTPLSFQVRHLDSEGTESQDKPGIEEAAPSIVPFQSPEDVDSGKPNTSVTELKKQAKASYTELTSLSRKTLEVAIQLGGILNELHSKLDHGEWGPFVREQLRAEERTLLNYRHLADYEAELRKSENFQDLGIVEALVRVRQLKKGDSNEDPVSEPEPLPEDASPCETSSAPADESFLLADQSEHSPTDMGWKEGILKWESVEPALSKLAEEVAPSVATARQRLVVGLAGKINELASGEVRAEQAEHLQIALRSLASLIETTLPKAGH